jgi:hypothetical protein
MAESMIEIQQLAMLEPDIAWDAAEGFIREINADGTINGEGLPSEKAHMVWVCHVNKPNQQKLAELYPKLRTYLLWRYDNPRWVYPGQTDTGVKSIEFITHWENDVNYAIKICEVLGNSSDIAMWKERKTAMYDNMRAWFFPALWAGYSTTTGTGWWDYPTYLYLALFQQLPDDLTDRLVAGFLNVYKPGKDLIGFDLSKYIDARYTAYGLLEKSSRYPALTGKWKELTNSIIRHILKTGEFCELMWEDKYETDGVLASSLTASELIDFTYMNSGLRMDSGKLSPF